MKKSYILPIIAIIYCIVASIIGIVYEYPAPIYIIQFLVSSVVLIKIGLEDKHTLKVSWRNTILYGLTCIPAGITIIHVFLIGINPLWWIVYIPGFAFVLVMIIYSFKTGRGGADRDIGLLTAIGFPGLVIAPLLIGAICSIVYSTMKKGKYPFLYPFSITFFIIGVMIIAVVLLKAGWINLL